MFDGNRIAVVVPAHNESRLIVQAVEQIPDFVDDIIVVDDASDDGTSDSLEKHVARNLISLLRHDSNQGVGGAIVTGYKRALELGADIVAVMAGDAQMDPNDLPGLLKPVVNRTADYSKGNRLAWPDAHQMMPPARFVGNHVLSVLTRFTSGYRQVRDSQCGYTVASARILSVLDLDRLYKRYGFPNDILAHMHSADASLAQVSVRPVYGSEVSGISLKTALFKVPAVLLRSAWHRHKRAQQNSTRALPGQQER